MIKKEIVVISGKGGTGKTSLLASLVPYFDKLIIADCDVDAPDLNILFDSVEKEKTDFIGLQRAYIDVEKCIQCGLCHQNCKFEAIDFNIQVDLGKCEGCGVCEYICPNEAITMKDSVVGQIHVAQTMYGNLVHGRLIPGEETSGKLVAQVRNRAKKIAQELNLDYILIDGSPGIACNVISSITGTNRAIIVIEPTLSGLHDLDKVYRLIQRFDIPISIVINKCDLSISGNRLIKEYCKNENLEIDLEIPFNKKMVESIVKKEIPSLYDREFFEKIGFEKFVNKLK